MDLNINDERKLQKADASLTEETMLRALGRLDVDEFAVLAIEDQRYVQTFRESENEYALEYREGSSATHFASSAHVALDVVEAAFAAYIGGDFDDWKSAVEWKLLSLK